MMAVYAYQQNDRGGASTGYVRYNVSPDVGQSVAPGEVITVSGQAFHRGAAHACASV